MTATDAEARALEAVWKLLEDYYRQCTENALATLLGAS